MVSAPKHHLGGVNFSLFVGFGLSVGGLIA